MRLPPHSPAHLLEPQSHPSLHGTDRHIEHLRNLCVSKAAVIGELDHLGLLPGQPLPAPPAPPRASSRRTASTSVSSLRLLTLLDCPLRWPAGARGPGCAAVRRSSCVWTIPTPTWHAAPRALVADLAAPDREERLLHDVLRHGSLPHHAVGERERRSTVPVIQNLERARVAALHDVHQLLIGQAWEVHVFDVRARARPDQRPRRLRTSSDTSCTLFSSALSPVAWRFLCC